MSEFKEVETIEDLLALDQDDITQGFMDGYKGLPKPDSTKSRGYWHGYNNAMRDRGAPSTSASINLAHEVVDSGFFLGLFAVKH